MRLNLRGGPQCLDEVHAALDTCWLLNMSVPSRIRTEMSIAVGEVAANIIEHARPAKILLAIDVFPGEILVEFSYAGEKADVDVDTTEMPDETAERGRGLALARATLGQLSYAFDSGMNHWRLVSKRWGLREEPAA